MVNVFNTMYVNLKIDDRTHSRITSLPTRLVQSSLSVSDDIEEIVPRLRGTIISDFRDRFLYLEFSGSAGIVVSVRPKTLFSTD